MIWFADFETVTQETKYFKEHNDTKVWLWYIKSFDEKQDRLGIEIKDFMEFVYSLDDKSIIYFHNLTWDGDFIIKYLVNCEDWNIINFDEKIENKTLNIFRRGKTIYTIKLFFDSKIITFKCSYQILPASIQNLGKSINIQKLKTDDEAFYDVEPQSKIEYVSQYLIDYIKNDVIIALRSFKNLKNILENIQEDFDIHSHITVGSITRWMMKQYDSAKCYITENEYEIASHLYRGGFTQFNKQYQKFNMNTNDMMIIDVNSAYPYFLSQNLPYGLSDKPIENETLKVYHLELEGKIKQEYNNIYCYMNMKDSFIDYKDYRYVNEMKKHNVYLFDFELETYAKFYNLKYTILQTWYVKTSNFLNEYMNTLFEYKTKYKQAKEQGMLLVIKILLNSAYGSLCLQDKYDNYFYLTQKNYSPYITKYRTIEIKKGFKKKIPDETFLFRGKSETYNISQFQCLRYQSLSDKPNHSNKLAAAWVTASQRCKLLNTIHKLSSPNKQWIYADTDSLFLHQLTDKDKEYINSLLSNKLGDWDIENKDSYEGTFSIFGAKKYDIDLNEFKKSKFAGVNTKVNWRCLEHYNLINKASLQIQRHQSGLTLTYKDKLVKQGSL